MLKLVRFHRLGSFPPIPQSGRSGSGKPRPPSPAACSSSPTTGSAPAVYDRSLALGLALPMVAALPRRDGIVQAGDGDPLARQGFRPYWHWRSRSGRPSSVDREDRNLVREMRASAAVVFPACAQTNCQDRPRLKRRVGLYGRQHSKETFPSCAMNNIATDVGGSDPIKGQASLPRSLPATQCVLEMRCRAIALCSSSRCRKA